MNIVRRIIICCTFLALANLALAANPSAIKSGDWNDPTVWSTAAVPTSAQTVTIGATYTVTLDGHAAESCAALNISGTLQTGEGAAGIYMGVGHLTVTGAITITATGTFQANTGYGGTSTVSVGGNIANAGALNLSPNSSSLCDVTVTGTSTISGAGTTYTFNNLTINASGFTVTISISPIIKESLVVAAGALSAGATTLNISGEANLSGNVTFTTGKLTVGDSLTVNTGVTLQFSTGQLSVSNDINNQGTIKYTGNGTLNATTVNNNGALTCGTSTTISPTNLVNYGSGTITVSTGKLTPSGNLVQESSGGITFSGNGTITVGQDLDVSSGSIVTTTGLITVTNGNLNLSGLGSIAPSSTGGITVSNGNLSMTGSSTITLLTTANLNVTKGTSSISAMAGITMATGTYTSGSDFTLNGSLTISGAGNLKIGGNYTFNGTYSGATATVTFNGTSGTQTISGTSAISLYKLTINPSAGVTVALGSNNGNAITVTNTLLLTTGTFDVGSNDLYIQGTMTNNNSTTALNAESQTVYFNGTTGTINGNKAFTFNNLTVNVGTGNTVTEAGTSAAPAEIVGGNLTISSGTLSVAATTIDIKGDFTNNATFTTTTGTMVFNGAVVQHINGTSTTTFNSITVTNTGVSTADSVDLEANISMATTGALSVTQGVLNCGAFAIAPGTNTTISVSAGATFVLGSKLSTATASFPVFKTYTLNATSTVVYESNATSGSSVSVSPTPYGNLYIYTGTATANYTLSAATAFTVAGNLVIGDGISSGTATLTVTSNNNITVDGNMTVNNNGAFSPGTGTITMSATAAQNHNQNINGTGTSSLTFYNLTINNLGTTNSSVIMAYPITVNNTLTLTKGILDVGAGNNQITCNGGLANNTGTTTGLNAENGTVLFTPTAAASISGSGQTNFYNLTFNPATRVTLSITGTHASPAEVVGHELNIMAGVLSEGTSSISVHDSATIASGATDSASTGRFRVANDINNSGTLKFTNTGTFNAYNFYNNAGATLTGASSVDTVKNNLYNYSTNASPASIGFTTGTLNVIDSAYVASSSSINFSGAGSLKTTGDINNNGTIALNAAGTLTAANFYNTNAGASGATLTLTSSTSTISKNLYDLSSTPISLTTGTINITDSAYIASNAAINITSTGKLQATGDVYNSGVISFGANGTFKAANFYNNSSAVFTGLNSTGTISGSIYNYSNTSPYFNITTGSYTAADSIYNASGATMTATTGKYITTSPTFGDINNNGALTFTVGGTLTVAHNLYANSPGTITMVTSTGTVTGNVAIASGGSIAYTTGTLTVGGNITIGGTLSYTGAGNLKVAGNFIDNGTYTYGTNTTTFNGTGTQTISGSQPASVPIGFYNVIVNGTGNTVSLADSVLINKAFLITAGNFDVSTNDYHVVFKGSFTNNGSTSSFNARKGCVWFNETTASTLTGTSSTIFNDAVIENGTLTISKPETFADTLALVTATTAGTFANASPNTVTIGNAFLNNSSAAFASSTGIILFENNTNSKCYIGSPVSGKTMTIQKLTENLAHATDTLFLLGNNILTVSTNDTIAQGVFHCQQYNFKGAAASKLDIQDNGTLILGIKSNATAVTFPTVFTTANITLTNHSTVIYEANAVQAISATPSNYGNLYLYTGAASVNKTLAGTLTVNGNMIVGDGISTGVATLPANANTVNLLGNETINSDGNVTFTTGPLNIGGNFTNNRGLAGFTGGTGTVTFNSSTSNQTIGGTQTTTFSNVTINNTASSGTVSLADSTIVGSQLTLTAGTFDVSASNYSLVVNGGFANNNSTGAFNGENGIVYFNGNETVGGSSASTFYNVTYNPGGANTVTLSSNETLNSNLVGASGTMAVGTNTVSVTGNVTLNASGGNLTFSSGAMNIGGNFTNNNSTSAVTGGTSTVTFNNGSTSQNIGGTFATTFNNVAISGYNVTITQNENAAGTFVINSGGTFDCGGTSKTMSVTGTASNSGTFLGDNGTLSVGGTLTNSGTFQVNSGNVNVTGAFTNGGTFNGGTGTLALANNLTNNSTFTASTGTVSFNGTGAMQSIAGTNAIAFYNTTLTGNAHVDISTLNESLTNILSITGASCVLSGSDSLTMVSTPSGTARIAPVTTGASITEPFIMQRYVGGTKANYEALASPAQSSTLHDWAYDPGFYMSGVGGPDGNAGSFKSVYTINEPSDAYVAVTTTSQALTPGLGLYIYMATSPSSFTPFTFATHGLPSYGTVNYPVTDDNTGSNLVGNPYDCPLQWTLLDHDGGNHGLLDTDFSVFDRTLGNWESSDGHTASCSGCQLSGAPNVIPAHQGFLIGAKSNGTMVFNETDKTTADELVYKPIGSPTADFVTIMLSDNMNEYQGNTAIQFKANTKTSFVAGEDVAYIPSLTEGAPVLYTLSSDGKFLNRNLQPLADGDEQDVMFYAGGTVKGNYTLTFNGIAYLAKYNCIQLEDLKSGKTIQIEEGSTYTYEQPNEGTYKFILHFKKLQEGEHCNTPIATGGISTDPNAAVDVFRNSTGAVAKFTYSQPEQVTITIYNALGQQLGNEITKDVMDESVEVPLPATNQMYILRIQTPTGVITKRIYQ